MMTKIDRCFLMLLAGGVALASWYNKDFQAVKEPVVVEVKKVTKEVVKVEKKVQEGVPDFAAMMDVKKKKREFFGFMKQMVEEENERLAGIRQEIEMLREKPALHETEEKWLMDMGRKFRVDEELRVSDEFYDDLLDRVDEIPVSLALVQAANESAWGTSRFAMEANNYFGQWCFTKGCGVIPGARPEGATYEVRKFGSPAESVRSYMHNLNTSHHYEGLREMRSKRRFSGEPVTGPLLAQGLYSYSIRGVDYVEELISMIESNGLLKYDLEKPLTELNEVKDDQSYIMATDTFYTADANRPGSALQ
ncbi:glucosaminidase domain-containing protein [Endozoicomonas arenosclerae]|uniref:glucosaminidase domain-containing protein n=1 Tax=Endozoicomonas arenosclerae TaxID=1633495 RepID=UPI000782EB94|nr:glucosaminidase domain-containing protein [Endozoicomonas arenosclerae]